MALELRGVTHSPLVDLTVSAPDAAIIGVVGEDGSGKGMLLCIAAGTQVPQQGTVVAGEVRRVLGPMDALNLAPAHVLCLAYTLEYHDALVRRRARLGLERLRQAGATILLASHDHALLRDLCDEVWWLDQGRLAAKGNPGEVLEKFERHVARRFAEWGAAMAPTLSPTMRRGDGRAVVEHIHPLDAEGRPTQVWTSGANAAIEVAVRFQQAVADPVVGIMLRTRIGIEVYATNSELEKVKLGPCAAGELLRIRYSFVCHLCPQEYTITAASHDPDGVWHDWLEDAVLVTVADSRYTLGIANLRSQVSVSRS